MIRSLLQRFGIKRVRPPRVAGAPRRYRLLAASLALASWTSSGCLMQQDLGHDQLADLSVSVAADLAVEQLDFSVPPDLSTRPDHAQRPDIACPPELTFCEVACRNLNSDPLRCGSCKTACVVGQICVMGHCDGCPKGQTACENHCVNLLESGDNCGACGHGCGLGKGCVAGVCM